MAHASRLGQKSNLESDDKSQVTDHFSVNDSSIKKENSSPGKNTKQTGSAEGWMEDPVLPTGWKVRQRPGHSYSVLQFMTADGQLIESVKKALSFLNELGIDYTQEMKKLKKKFSKPRINKDKSNELNSSVDIKSDDCPGFKKEVGGEEGSGVEGTLGAPLLQKPDKKKH